MNLDKRVGVQGLQEETRTFQAEGEARMKAKSIWRTMKCVTPITPTAIHMLTHSHIGIHTHMHVHTHGHIFPHILTHRYTRALTHTCAPSRTHARTHMRTHTSPGP